MNIETRSTSLSFSPGLKLIHAFAQAQAEVLLGGAQEVAFGRTDSGLPRFLVEAAVGYPPAVFAAILAVGPSAHAAALLAQQLVGGVPSDYRLEHAGLQYVAMTNFVNCVRGPVQARALVEGRECGPEDWDVVDQLRRDFGVGNELILWALQDGWTQGTAMYVRGAHMLAVPLSTVEPSDVWMLTAAELFAAMLGEPVRGRQISRSEFLARRRDGRPLGFPGSNVVHIGEEVTHEQR